MTLREEYKKNKEHKDVVVTEAAYAWVADNIVLINEQIDRRTVKRLIDSIGKFDEVFGPFKNKIPALAAQIDDAELGLEKVITGRANEKKAADMLKRLGFLYNTFSRFFGQDLPVLLSAPLFFAAKANPQVRLDILQPKAGEKYNPAGIRDALKHALEPGKDDMRLLRKIYGNKKVPLVDSESISAQMLQMSFNELEALTNGMGKGGEQVPMIATPPDSEEAPEAALPQEGVVHVARESVDRSQKKDIILESHQLLLEINQENMSNLVGVMNQLKASFDIPGMESINQAVNSTISRAQKELAANQWLQGKAAKQLLGFYNLMDNLNQLWPQLRQTFGEVGPEGQLSADQESNLFKLLKSATKDSVFGSLAKALKLSTPHAPGLEPDKLVNAIVDAAKQKGGIENVSKLFQKSQGMPKTSTQGEPNLGGQAKAADPAAAAQSATGAAASGQTGTASGTQSSAPGGGAELSSAEIAQDISKILGLTGKAPAALQNIIDTKITKAGYKIVKAK